ncbi:uncharacterized protein LOC134416874 [Melospiza melodia melodia]|uniref:uncharacterized protein LOC134416874 n=1 Tax=Melospiza melodia melodia TaxID=1914991 RepID=UPI002FD1DDFE
MEAPAPQELCLGSASGTLGMGFGWDGGSSPTGAVLGQCQWHPGQALLPKSLLGAASGCIPSTRKGCRCTGSSVPPHSLITCGHCTRSPLHWMSNSSACCGLHESCAPAPCSWECSSGECSSMECSSGECSSGSAALGNAALGMQLTGVQLWECSSMECSSGECSSGSAALGNAALGVQLWGMQLWECSSQECSSGSAAPWSAALGVQLHGVQLWECSFGNAALGVQLHGVQLWGVQLWGVQLHGVQLWECSSQECCRASPGALAVLAWSPMPAPIPCPVPLWPASWRGCSAVLGCVGDRPPDPGAGRGWDMEPVKRQWCSVGRQNPGWRCR